AAREFGVSRATVFRKFKNAGLVGSKGVRTVDVVRALFGDTNEERAKLLKAQRKLAERKLGAFDGDFIDLKALIAVLYDSLTEVQSCLEQSHIARIHSEMVLELFNKIPGKIDEVLAKTKKSASKSDDEEEAE